MKTILILISIGFACIPNVYSCVGEGDCSLAEPTACGECPNCLGYCACLPVVGCNCIGVCATQELEESLVKPTGSNATSEIITNTCKSKRDKRERKCAIRENDCKPGFIPFASKYPKCSCRCIPIA